ncbi:hypothetical protein CVT24_009497 [Panaeolus cyanescens]|uniref:Membrane anchor Opy2 N-terminal domain-containing protein n=1 Tax=Panaeolus cyanescens TaxID=181874 RepID=A0A409VAG8_9AGAR|nr:hypothetical protein CVT24_009497 [Panaeolus cyanescens]
MSNVSNNVLFPRQSEDCNKPCPPVPACSCPAGTECIQVSRCDPIPGGGSPGKQGVSKGALAGAVVGILAALILVIVLFIRRRKRRLLRMSRQKAAEPPKDIPASAETVLKRPDPTGKPPSELSSSTIRHYAHSQTTIDLDPHSQESAGHTSSFHPLGPNPFDDNNSIQTAGTEGTNVIPIALVTPDPHRTSISNSEAHSSSTAGSQPMRPPRSPDLNLNLDHTNVSTDNIRAPMNYPQSTISGISRNSYLSSASYSSDFLNEAPMIITPTRTNVRQVMGVVKAEVINTGSLPSSPAPSDNTLRIPSHVKPVTKSPLAATSFGPNDLVREVDEEGNDPFGDENVSTRASPPATARTFDTTAQSHDSRDWAPEGPKLPWSKLDNQSRPSSISTQAGSIVDIASATRVNVGLKTPGSANSYRTTMGRLVTPPVNQGPLEEQQQRALAQAQQAQAMERRRISGSSMMSTTTRADSILESFPFVPPSPISDRPIRSPPVSPLAQQSFTNNGTASPNSHQHTFIIAPPSPMSHQSFSAGPTKTSFNPDETRLQDSPLPAPPDRRTLGLSTGSQLSTASSGLGSFPFQIESEPSADNGQTAAPSSFKGRQRASLDTLALTSDLSSYPLDFGRDSVVPDVPQRK